jgi:iron complex transport system permease protein
MVMTIANMGTRASAVKLLLSGLAINAVFSSFSSFIVFVANDKDGIQDITFWLMGSLAGAKWSSIGIVYAIVGLGTVFFMTQYRTLNLMLLGDDVSITLGNNLHKSRHLFLLMTTCMIGFIVYVSGMIGFIGLVIPHFVRLIFGTNHKIMVPIVFLSGGLFMIWADILSRIILPYTELPIGILVSMIGAPCFIYLLMKKQYGFGGGD